MKTSFATAAICLAIFVMALVPNADAKLTSVRGDGPSERVTQKRALKKGQEYGKDVAEAAKEKTLPPAARPSDDGRPN
jgi:hypothetical protein